MSSFKSNPQGLVPQFNQEGIRLLQIFDLFKFRFPRGQQLENVGLPPAILLSKSLNLQGFNSAYPGNPPTWGDYIRKDLKDKGLLTGEVDGEISCHAIASFGTR